MIDKVPDDIRAQLEPVLIESRDKMLDQADVKECAYITLRGTIERFMMLLEFRSEKHYEVGMQAIEKSIAEYREAAKLSYEANDNERRRSEHPNGEQR